MTAALRARGVSKSLGGRAVLSDVSFEVPSGSVCAVVGPNGAGKTTLISLVCGLRRPDLGIVEVVGLNPRSLHARRRFALVQQDIDFPPTLRVAEVVRYVAGSRPAPRPGFDAGSVLHRLGLAAFDRTQVGALSGGQRRRLAVALALANAPDVVFLDEATAHLDGEGRAATWRLLDDYVAAGGTALVSSHLLADVDQHADSVIALLAGQVVVAGTAADVRAAGARVGGAASVSFRVSPGRADAVRAGLSGLGEVVVSGRQLWTVRTVNAEAAVAAALHADPQLSDLQVSGIGVAQSIELILYGPS